MMLKNYFFTTALLLYAAFVAGQDLQRQQNRGFKEMKWTKIATAMPNDWYGTDEARQVAENVLIGQKNSGGWEKNRPYHGVFSDSLKRYFNEAKNSVGGTFDNGSTITELRFLAKMYARHTDPRYRQAFNKGLQYIFAAQYDNGGWPQFYPAEAGGMAIWTDRTAPYSMHITYNDNAMVNIMDFLKGLFLDDPEFRELEVSEQNKQNARKAFDHGVDCILKTQIRVGDKLTVWCAQHHYQSLAPVKARSYELPSYSGSESAGIVRLLMDIEQPSSEVLAAVEGARKWFEENKIEGIRLVRQTDSQWARNTVVVCDSAAAAIWARFYDLETRAPYFCDRDGVKKYALSEIGPERRNGYSWYTDAPPRCARCIARLA